jgi:hypothetical protein
MKRDVLDNAVAFVEDSEHRHAQRHGRDSALAIGGRSDLPGTRCRRILLLSAFAARSERERGEQGCRGGLHAYSGIQGS